jgi:hypothetical protein
LALAPRSFAGEVVLRSLTTACAAVMCLLATGCSLLPDIKHKPQYFNPFPQIRTVAVLPFVNQSEEPTLSAERVTLAYIDELQSIPGFEVLPMGVVKAKLEEYPAPLACGEDFQAFARALGVDAVLLGSVVDYSPYYPPRLSMKVNWYAANPGFHPVLPGYGLPWGTEDEKKIPRWVHYEAQRTLAAEQLKTQTPQLGPPAPLPDPVNGLPEPIPADAGEAESESEDRLPFDSTGDAELVRPTSVTEAIALEGDAVATTGTSLPPLAVETPGQTLPADWPDARGFVPDPPQANPPPLMPQHEPIISHMRNYNGHDEDFTQRLEDYFYFRDDARYGGWQAYLQRSEDFIRVCCHFHITETLACRGGEDESRLIFRWPIDRYQR